MTPWLMLGICYVHHIRSPRFQYPRYRHVAITLKWPWRDIEDILRWHWSDLEVTLKWPWNALSVIDVILKWHWSDLEVPWSDIEVTLKLPRSFIEVTLKCLWSDLEMTLTCHWSDLETTLKRLINYTWCLFKIIISIVPHLMDALDPWIKLNHADNWFSVHSIITTFEPNRLYSLSEQLCYCPCLSLQILLYYWNVLKTTICS